MVPQLVAQFWNAVQRHLEDDHGFSTERAGHFVQQYRQLLAEHHVGDAVYNSGIDAAVATIVSASEHGFAEPLPVGQ